MVASKPMVPWYTELIITAKQERARRERRWRKSRLTVHGEHFKEQRLHISKQVRQAKAQYSCDVLSGSPSHPDLYRIFNQLTGGKRGFTLPEHASLSDLLNQFGVYFCSKIVIIRSQLDSVAPTYDVRATIEPVKLAAPSDFGPVSVEQVIKLVSEAPTKTCSLDPMPAALVKEHAP